MADPSKSYTQEEVNEILRRALSQQALREQSLSHDELAQVAAEVGIDRQALEAATAEIAKTREVEVAQRAEAAELANERKTQLKRLVSSGIRLGVVNGVLYFVDLRFSGGTWFQWPLIASGLLLALQARHVIAPEQRLARRRRREERQRLRAQRRAEFAEWKQKLVIGYHEAPGVAREFEVAVEAGVTALVKVATRKIEEHLERHDRHRRR